MKSPQSPDPAVSGAPPAGASALGARSGMAGFPPPESPGAGTKPASRRIVSIRWIATAVAVVLTAVAALSVGAVTERHARNDLTEAIESRLVLIARDLSLTSSSALLGDFPELMLQPLVKETMAHEPELTFVVVVDHLGRIQGHVDPRQLGSQYQPVSGLSRIPIERNLRRGEALEANRDLIVASAVVPNPSGGILGRIMVGLNRSYIQERVAASRREQMLALTLLVLLGVVTAFVLMSQLLRPIGVLRSGIERIGRGDLETPIPLRDHTELGLLADAVNEMAASIRQAQVELLERERLTYEVELAREIQQSLLPRGPLTAGGCLFRGDHRAAAEVGGDYFDVLPLPDGRVAIAIADVSGKGLAGCLIMSMLSALLRALRNVHSSPAALLEELDERLGESLRPGVFVTMFYAIVDPATGRMVFASAGHNPMILYRHSERRTEAISSKGVPLAALRGGFARGQLRDEVVCLQPGDVMVQFTDGYSEAFDPTRTKEYGVDRIEQVVARFASQGAERISEALIRDVHDWTGAGPLNDDQTLLVVTRAVDAEASTGGTPSLGADDTSEAIERLIAAESRGHGLRLSGALHSTAAIHEWLSRAPVLSQLGLQDLLLLRSGLYEVCANVAEHGLGEDATRGFELWWHPPPPGEVSRATPEQLVRKGAFVLRDDGIPFRLDTWKGLDFEREEVRRRGRGLGLEIIHRVMSEVSYNPGTARGNITLLTFGPRSPISTRQGDLG